MTTGRINQVATLSGRAPPLTAEAQGLLKLATTHALVTSKLVGVFGY
jgi:hypothetical protein